MRFVVRLVLAAALGYGVVLFGDVVGRSVMHADAGQILNKVVDRLLDRDVPRRAGPSGPPVSADAPKANARADVPALSPESYGAVDADPRARAAQHEVNRLVEKATAKGPHRDQSRGHKPAP